MTPHRDEDFLEIPAAAYAAPLLDSSDPGGHAGADVAALQAALGDRYSLEREVGRGGMATVFLAHDVKHSRRVALKVLHADLAPALGAERFTREIATVAALSHPHILPLFDSGVAGGHLYYAMPYVEGESLRDRLAREKQLSVPVAIGIVREIADALGFAHAKGVVHRDIKPANIMMTSRESGSHALLADFGIARAVEQLTGSHAAGGPLTATGIALGTPTYMSPEQATGERDVDGRSDIYSLGCVLYELLTGEPPFTGPTAQAVIAKRLSGPPPSVRRTRPSVGAGLDAVVARAMATLPGDRFQTAGEFAAALAAGSTMLPPPVSRPSNQRVAAYVGLGVAVVATIAAALLWRIRPAVPASAAAMVVLPPTPVAPDTALARLGRELAITLSANLDGVGGIRVADALGVLARVPAGASALSLDDARVFAQRAGGRSVMRGTLIRAGDSVRVDVALHRVACDEAECAQPLATASISAPADDITSLTERTTWALLRGLWQREGAPTPSLAAVTTRSIPALKAFLDGERAIVDGRWRAAPALYELAFKEDSTFLLAYWRYAFARNYWSQPVDPAIRAKYRDNRDRFPLREQMAIDAELSDSSSVRLSRARAVAEAYPDHWPGWWTLSERLTHDAPLLGTTSTELRAALEKTLSLNPRMTSAWMHMFWLALWERDTVLMDSVMRRLTELRYDTISVGEQGYDELAYFRHLASAVHGGGITRDATIREFGVQVLLAMPATIDPTTVGLGASQFGLAQEQMALSSRVLARNPTPAIAAGHHLAMAIAQAQRGMWDSSVVSLDAYASRSTDARAPLYSYRMGVVGAWLGGLAPAAAAARRAAVVRDSANLPPASRAELAWLDGILAVANNDAKALDAARGRLRGADSVTSPALDRSLAAFALSIAGDRDRAADSLVALERERAESGAARFRSDAHPFLTAVDRLAAGRWLRERGQPGDAARLLSWYQAVVVPMRATRQANAVVQGLAYLEQARVAEALGQRDLARVYYQRFLWHYDAPTALHRHLVEEATQAVSRLSAGSSDRPR